MSASFNIVLGIVSGVLTATFLYILSLIFKNILIPWYQRIKYKGVELKGKWSGMMIDSPEISFPFERQKIKDMILLRKLEEIRWILN